MKHVKLFEEFVNEDKFKNALNNIDKWMPDDSELQDEYYELINGGDVEGMKDFLDNYAEEDALMKYGVKFKDLEALAKAIIKVNEEISYKDIKVGSILNFADGETWKVTKFIGNPSKPRGVFALPYGDTKEKYVSVAIEFKMDDLEKSVESINEYKKLSKTN